MSTSYAIAVAVGPDPKELDRIIDLIDSVRAYESAPCRLVMIDDGENDRSLATRFDFPANWTPVSLPHPRRQFPERAAKYKGKGICAAIRQALSWIAKNAAEARFTLKMDTDALVIGPFIAKIVRLLEKHPNAGMIGAYDRTPSGSMRDISRNAKLVEALHQSGRENASPERAAIASHIDAARANGYRFGEHCLGGAYALSNELLARMNRAGYLDDPALWLPIDCPEDVMVGIYTKAVGCDYVSFVDRNEVFGVRHRGLDDTPENLLSRGYSVIHAVKNDEKLSEAEIRDFFRRNRLTATSRR